MQFKVPAQPENEKNEGRRNGERDVNLKKKAKGWGEGRQDFIFIGRNARV